MNKIRFYRLKAKLSQEALANLCGWEGNGRVGNYELGIRTPGVRELQAIRDALSAHGVVVTLEQLVGERKAKTA